MTLKTFDLTGQEVKTGDLIQSFRGETAKFVRATRARILGQSGKVLVRWDNNNMEIGEYYDKVFDLHVKNVQQ